MRLQKVTIRGFRCFGPEETTIELNALSAFVGANGTGKSAALMALVRMFGTSNAQRSITREDFHVPTGEQNEPSDEIRIEAWFEFPELLDDADAAASLAVPECLKHIVITGVGGPEGAPICRIRLRATWTSGTTAEGEIEQAMAWVNSDDLEPSDEQTFPLSSVERGLIQVFYVPATRDAERELRAVSGTILHRVLKRMPWSEDLLEKIAAIDGELTKAVRDEPAMKELEDTLRIHWSALSGGATAPVFALGEADLAGILRRLDAQIADPGGLTRPIGLLSEGERSLLYFALVESALTFEAALAANGAPSLDDVPRPALTILAVEEPENHLAPQYLGRILAALRRLLDAAGVQALLTSHSASIMRRIEPAEIRHFRVTENGTRRITALTLPDDSEEAFKYVREAVKSHPELYFASVVVLGEGASEEIVLPRVARALGLDIDPRFVAVVPLGGRHVHHFWRLLREIGTPHVTLVDLDLERHGGGWKRVHDLLDELVHRGEDRTDVFDGSSPEDIELMLTSEPVSCSTLAFARWINHLETAFDIFLSAPLDLDFAMLSAFPASYRSLAPKSGGPRLPKTATEKPAFTERVIRAVLGADGGDGSTFSADDLELFAWYSYFFVTGSKPATHARALAGLEDTELAAATPDVLRRLVERVKTLAPK